MFLIAVIFRQTNIVWLLFTAGAVVLRCSLFSMFSCLTLLLLLREIEEPWKQITGSQLSMMPLFLLSYISGLYPYPRGRLITKLLPYVMVAILFMLFILYNGSIVVGVYANAVTVLLGMLVVVMHQYKILVIFRLTDIAFPILVDTDSRHDINIPSNLLTICITVL